MGKLIHIIICCVVVCLPGMLPAQYNKQQAADYAEEWCNDRNLEFYCDWSPDCINFVSQILQNGCMGVCGNWVCQENPIDPASVGRCVWCNQRSTIIRISDAIPFFQQSTYWYVEGPFTTSTIHLPPDSGGPGFYLYRGDVILYDWRNGTGHSQWVYTDEPQSQPYFRCLIVYHSFDTCPSDQETFEMYLYTVNPDKYIYLCHNTGSPQIPRNGTGETLNMKGVRK
jgi:hypothetical protein